MIALIALDELSPAAQKIAGPAAPPKLKQMAAKGIAPGIRPGEVVALLVIFAQSEDASLRQIAQVTLAAPPPQLLTGALSSELHPAAIDALARACIDRIDVLEKLFAMQKLDPETVEHVARLGNEAVMELIATNEDRLLKHPRIIELLYLNKHTRMSTADRLIDLAKRNNVVLTGIGAFREATLAIENELISEATFEPTPDDVLFRETHELAEQLERESAPDEDTHIEDEEGQEVLKAKFLPLYKQVASMTISQKVRAAILGSKEVRMLLVRDQNRLVASAAIRSPLLQETDVVLISRNRNIADEVLRVLGSSPEWLKSYAVKKNLVENPKTPVALCTRLVQHLREADLRNIARSKNVTAAVKDAARRHLERRKT